MRRILATVLALASFAAHAQLANQLRLDQRNPGNTGYISRFVMNSYPPVDCALFISGTMQVDGSLRPDCAKFGPNLEVSGGQLNIVGVVGQQGAQGIQGIQGIQGVQGAPGVNGTNGTNGAQGIQGAAGPKGDTGATGPAGASAPAFDYGAPTARTLVASTAYQATNTAKAAVITVTPICTNNTTVIAASACTMNVRYAASAPTCSTGTVVATWSSTYALGLVLTNTSGSPIDIKLPIGGAFILCPTAGTFTFTAVEQSAG